MGWGGGHFKLKLVQEKAKKAAFQVITLVKGLVFRFVVCLFVVGGCFFFFFGGGGGSIRRHLN